MVIIMIAFIEGLLCRATNLLAYLVVVWTCPYQPKGMRDCSFIGQRTSVRTAALHLHSTPRAWVRAAQIAG